MTARYAVFDLDGTLTSRDTYKWFLRNRLKARPWRGINCIPLAVQYWQARRDARDHVWIKQKALRAIVGGSHRDELLEFAAGFAREVCANDVSDAARARLDAHRTAGDSLILCSASFDFYVEAVASVLGFDSVICTRAGWRDDRLSGEIEGLNCFGAEKIRRLDALVGQERERVTAYTDHHSDLPLLEWADEAVAVSPTRRMRELADEKGFAVESWHAQATF